MQTIKRVSNSGEISKLYVPYRAFHPAVLIPPREQGIFLALVMVNSIPGFLVPGSGTNSYTRSRDRPGKTQQTGIFCGKALLLTSSGAREQESKRAKKRTRTRKQEREKEQEQESKREKKNGKTPSLLRRIILRLGRITP